MKKFIHYLSVITLVFLASVANGQVVDGITYQAVAIDETGNEVAGQDINGNILHSKSFFVRFTIIESSPSGNIMYQEEHEALTDHNGLFSLVIGHGDITSLSVVNTVLDVNWGTYKHFLQDTNRFDGQLFLINLYLL